MVEVAEIIVHKADEPNLLADLLDADALAGEDGAEIDLLPIEADAPACGHGDGSVVEWVIEFGQASVDTVITVNANFVMTEMIGVVVGPAPKRGSMPSCSRPSRTSLRRR